MKISSREVGEIHVIDISGRIDPLGSSVLEEELNKIASGSNCKCVLNMKMVDYINSAGLRIFLTALKKVKAGGGDMKLCCMSSNLLKIFQIAGFVTLFEISGTEEEALHKFS